MVSQSAGYGQGASASPFAVFHRFWNFYSQAPFIGVPPHVPPRRRICAKQTTGTVEASHQLHYCGGAEPESELGSTLEVTPAVRASKIQTTLAHGPYESPKLVEASKGHTSK